MGERVSGKRKVRGFYFITEPVDPEVNGTLVGAIVDDETGYVGDFQCFVLTPKFMEQTWARSGRSWWASPGARLVFVRRVDDATVKGVLDEIVNELEDYAKRI